MKRSIWNDQERAEWLDNDEGLYEMQRQSGLSKKEFIMFRHWRLTIASTKHSLRKWREKIMPFKPTTAMRKDKLTGKSVIMQHRHMAFIANVIATSGELAEDKRRWANYFAYDLAKTNPAFDRARFFNAVGIDDPYVTQAAYGPHLTLRP